MNSPYGLKLEHITHFQRTLLPSFIVRPIDYVDIWPLGAAGRMRAEFKR